MNPAPVIDGAVDSLRFRSSVSRFATGIAIVSCLDEQGQPQGMTVSSFTSISLEPPTVLVSLRPGRTHARICQQGRYGVSILGAEQEAWSQHFSGHPQTETAPAWETAARVPVLRDALAWFECQVDELLQVHDHTLFVARVTACGHASGAPLMFFASSYHRAMDRSTITQDRRA
ncbi:styrene monooxygenase NADH-dependent flavin reductase subunit StyB [Hydrogenophaga sp.]|uniref:styrene monooxygenase NADH-dependent flavin reductase subunit StyB n=1 Tax=Hydrogenophaga sp. TaxID=1904254 RepID=UPI003F72CACC